MLTACKQKLDVATATALVQDHDARKPMELAVFVGDLTSFVAAGDFNEYKDNHLELAGHTAQEEVGNVSERPSTESAFPERSGLLATLPVGAVIGGRYEVRALIGHGGYAVVYEAYDRQLGSEVAVKILREDRMHASSLARFRREVLIARSAASPRIVRIFDIGACAGSVFLTMERVRGESLRARLRRGPLAVDDAVRVAIGILDGIRDLHGLGILHRDIKPENILLDENDEVRIVDFGLARYEDDDTKVTDSSGMVGSADYISPEQALGQPVDPRTDLYSLGIVLYEMLVGELPFPSTSSIGAVLARVRGGPPDVRRVRATLPTWISHVIRRLLQRDRKFRYDSAEEVIRALRTRSADVLPIARWYVRRVAAMMPQRRVILTSLGLAALGLALLLSGELVRLVEYRLGQSDSLKEAAARAADCDLCPGEVDRFLRRVEVSFNHDLNMVYLPQLRRDPVHCFPLAARHSFEGKTHYSTGRDLGAGIFIERLLLQYQVTRSWALRPIIAKYASHLELDQGKADGTAISDFSATAIGRFGAITGVRRQFEQRVAVLPSGSLEATQLRTAIDHATEGLVIAVHQYCVDGFKGDAVVSSLPEYRVIPLLETLLLQPDQDRILNSHGHTEFVLQTLEGRAPIRFSELVAAIVDRGAVDANMLVAGENGRSFAGAVTVRGFLRRKSLGNEPGFSSEREEDQSVPAGSHTMLMAGLAQVIHFYALTSSNSAAMLRLRRDFASDNELRSYQRDLDYKLAQISRAFLLLKAYYLLHVDPATGLPGEYLALPANTRYRPQGTLLKTDALAALRYAYAMNLMGDRVEVKRTLGLVLKHAPMTGSPVPPRVSWLAKMHLYEATEPATPPLESGLLSEARLEWADWRGSNTEADLLLYRLLIELRFGLEPGSMFAPIAPQLARNAAPKSPGRE